MAIFLCLEPDRCAEDNGAFLEPPDKGRVRQVCRRVHVQNGVWCHAFRYKTRHTGYGDFRHHLTVLLFLTQP